LNAVELSRRNPVEYPIPSRERKDAVNKSTNVQLALTSIKWEVGIQRVWVRVTEIRSRSFTGKVISEQKEIPDLKCGDEIKFNDTHILGIYV